MPMSATEIERHIREAFPDAKIQINDLAGDGDHYSAYVCSNQFRGLSRVRQHQLVYEALHGKMGGELHALALQTATLDSQDSLESGSPDPSKMNT